MIEGCGYEVNEITFEELLERVKGVFECSRCSDVVLYCEYVEWCYGSMLGCVVFRPILQLENK